MEFVIEKFRLDEKAKVSWLACLSVGSKVEGDSNWILKGGPPLHNGYKTARLLKRNDCIYKVVCEIEKTFLGLPSFTISAYKLEEQNCTTASATASI